MKEGLLLCIYFAVLVFNVHAAEWYEGGTLHKATAAEWQAATASNKLATAADFLAAIKAARSMSELKTKGNALQKCITESTKDSISHNLKVSEVAAACVVLLGYQ